jgi:serine/threonine protein phosphatase PrpC
MYGPGQSIRLRSSARTSKGRVRQNNEDSVHLWGDEAFVLAVVADGMGGAVAGEEASRIAVETVQEQMVNGIYRKPDDYGHLDSYDLAEKLESAVKQANANILKRAIARPEFKGMGTTMTMAFARQSDVVLAHVGDSRAYFVDGHDGSISQLTADHSFVQALVDAGHITAEEAEDHPMKNVLYRALGQAPDVDIDVISDGHLLHVGDRLVLCSDGLTLHVKTPEIGAIAMKDSDPNVISQRLIELANSRGGKDNISVIVIVVEGDGTARTTSDAAMEMDMSFPDDDSTLPMPRNNNNNNNNLPRKAGASSSSDKLNMLSASAAPYYGEGRDDSEPLQ